MNWTFLLIAFSLAVFMGASLARFLARSRPEWSARRRLLTSASVLPAFTVVMTIAGLGFVLVSGPAPGENMQDLALIATAVVGAFVALLALAGGLVGAGLAQRKRHR